MTLYLFNVQKVRNLSRILGNIQTFIDMRPRDLIPTLEILFKMSKLSEKELIWLDDREGIPTRKSGT